MELTQTEKDKITGFVEDEVLLNAIKKVFLQEVQAILPKASPEVSDEILGQNTRASLKAIELLEKGFHTLNTLKKVVSKKDNFNQAR